MVARALVTIWCDGLPARPDEQTCFAREGHEHSASEARKAAKAAGWTRRRLRADARRLSSPYGASGRTLDLCPACSKLTDDELIEGGR